MSRRFRPLPALLLGALIATCFGVSAGLASRQDDIPTLQAKLKACRADLAEARIAVGRAEGWVALARRNKLVYLGNSPVGPIFVGVDQVRDSLILQYVTGRITKAKLASSLHVLGIKAAATLKAITSFRNDARAKRDELAHKCATLAQQLKQAQAGGGGGGGGGGGSGTVTFTLQPVKPSDVTNTHQSELTIDPAGMTAHLDHCCDGGGWKIDYSWEVPQTITPGKTYEITLHEKFLSVNPNQPLGDQMNALAPDFAQAIQAHWPDTPDVSKTFTVPLAADQKDSSDVPITIGFVSSGVTYHYRK